MNMYISGAPRGAGDGLHADAKALLERLARPARDVRFLKPEERRLAIAVLLASMVPADHKVRDVEIDRLMRMLGEQYRVTGKALATIKEIAIEKHFCPDELKAIAALVPEILNIEDRCSLIGLLWEIALCDKELHVEEEEAIYLIADKLDVPRKRTIEQQARAASRG